MESRSVNGSHLRPGRRTNKRVAKSQGSKAPKETGPSGGREKGKESACEELHGQPGDQTPRLFGVGKFPLWNMAAKRGPNERRHERKTKGERGFKGW